MSGDHFGDATGYPGMGPDGADPGLAADYAALDSWAEDQPLTRFDFIEAEAVFTDDLDEQRPAGADEDSGSTWIPGFTPAGDSEPLRVRPNRPPAARHRPVSDPARRRGPRAVLHAVGRARSGRAARAGHGARIPFPFGSAQARLMACTLLLAVLGTGLLAGYLAHTGAPALRVVMPPVHSVLPVHPSKSHAATSPAPRRSALATSALASGRSTAPRVPATMVAGAAGLSPLVCDAPTPTGLPVAPRRSAARGVSGGSLKAGWSYFTDGSGFHLAVPDGWSYQRIGTTYCFRDPAGTRVMSLAVRRDPGIDPLRVCRAADQRLRKQGVPGYTALRIEVVPLVHRAADWEHRYRGAGGALRHASTRWFVVNGRAYALGWATPADDWAAERSNLHMVQATFYSTAGPADAAQRG